MTPSQVSLSSLKGFHCVTLSKYVPSRRALRALCVSLLPHAENAESAEASFLSTRIVRHAAFHSNIQTFKHSNIVILPVCVSWSCGITRVCHLKNRKSRFRPSPRAFFACGPHKKSSLIAFDQRASPLPQEVQSSGKLGKIVGTVSVEISISCHLAEGG